MNIWFGNFYIKVKFRKYRRNRIVILKKNKQINKKKRSIKFSLHGYTLLILISIII